MTEIRPKLLPTHAQSETVPLRSAQSGSEELDSDSVGAEIQQPINDPLVPPHRQRRAKAREPAGAVHADAINDFGIKLAEQRVNKLDAERRAIESRLNEANTRIKECENALEKSESRNVVTEAKLTAAEHRARQAESRANAARTAMVRIEEANRTHLLRPDRPYSIKSSKAAA